MATVLSTYLNLTKLQLQYPSTAAGKLYSDADLTTFINQARGQLAGDAECIANFASLTLTAGQRQYNFSSVALGSPSTGIQGIFNIRQSLLQLGTGSGGQGYVWMRPRSFPWFTLYHLNNVVPDEGQPSEWSQFGQGVSGTIFIDLVPDQAYTLSLDTICYPVDLVDDSTVEAIPYPWTDVVPFYAAWYALCASQKQTDADKMYQRVELYMNRARKMSNPDVVPQAYRQPVPDPAKGLHLGIPTRGRGGA